MTSRLLTLSAMAKATHGYGYQSKLACDLGVSPSTVSRWLSGVVAIPKATELCIVVMWQVWGREKSDGIEVQEEK